jgi:hypothetical protein
LFWDASPEEIQQRHIGHKFRAATEGTEWEFICLKMGWIK